MRSPGLYVELGPWLPGRAHYSQMGWCGLMSGATRTRRFVLTSLWINR